MLTGDYVIGLDFGTLSGRAVLVDAATGEELATTVCEYAHGVMDKTLDSADGRSLPPDFALQDPRDYLEVLGEIVGGVLEGAGADPERVIGIGVDFTSATVLACRSDGTPVCLDPRFENDPHSWVKLWKHHGAHEQARRIQELAESRQEPWLTRYGGFVSPEMLLPKVFETFEESPGVYEATEVFCDAVDWITWQLTGRLTFAAGDSGYKRMLQDGHYPSREFLGSLDPRFADVYESKMSAPVLSLGEAVGRIRPEFAGRFGLRSDVVVAVGSIDAHAAAVGVDAVETGQMTAIMGTSACYLVSSSELHDVPGMFGVVDGGIVSGLWGYEAGQTAVGDIFAWFLENCVPPRYFDEAQERGVSLHEVLTDRSREQEVGEHGLVALDWHNGNRSILGDPGLSGLMLGQTLSTIPEDQYRALLEATAFGARTIIQSFRKAGVEVNELVVAGGIARNDFYMQMLCDVCHVPLSVATTEQPGALGAAAFAAVAAGVYPDVPSACRVIGAKQPGVYQVDEARAARYDDLYACYLGLHDHFGADRREIMHRLRSIRHTALASQ